MSGGFGHHSQAYAGDEPLAEVELERRQARRQKHHSFVRRACILHAVLEAYVGGSLALVKTGDTITADVPARTIHLNVFGAELVTRKAAWIKSK